MRKLTSDEVRTLGELFYGSSRWQAELARDMGCRPDTVGRALIYGASTQFTRRLLALAKVKSSEMRGRASRIDMLLIDASEPQSNS